MSVPPDHSVSSVILSSFVIFAGKIAIWGVTSPPPQVGHENAAQVTVLFADMAGFTRLADTLDLEEVHRVINSCFELITAELHRFEGTINQYTGDLFGAPIAHEDSARRAVHAALGIQRALAEQSRRLEAERGMQADRAARLRHRTAVPRPTAAPGGGHEKKT